MKLQFIDNSGEIDDATKKSIRRHAARGKNVGRKLSRHSRARASAQGTLEQGGLTNKDGSDGSTSSDDEMINASLDCWQIDRFAGNCFSASAFPIQPPTEEYPVFAQALEFMRSPRHRPDLEKAIVMDVAAAAGAINWLGLMLTDQAYYHCTLGIFLHCILPNAPQSGPMAARHLSKTYRLINDRLSQGKQVTNSTMAVVMSLSSYESTRGRYEQGVVHTTGLRKMVECRGGMDQMAIEQPALFLKLFRIDLDYALRLGTPPKLNNDILQDIVKTRHAAMFANSSSKIPRGNNHIQIRHHLGSEMLSIWDQVTALCQRVNQATTGHGPKFQPTEFHITYTWLGHNVISYSSLQKANDLKRAERIAYLGTVCIVTSFLCGLDWRVPENPLLSRLIQKEAQIPFDIDFSNSGEEFRLWLLFMGAAVNLQDSSHDDWLVPATRQCLAGLNLKRWDRTKSIITKYPWVEDLYSKKAAELFYRAMHVEDLEQSPS